MLKKRYNTDVSCLACGKTTPGGNTLHHVKTRGSGGCDSQFNLMPLCHEHHVEVHMKGLVDFAERYYKVHKWLKDNKWEFFELTWKWIRFPQKEE